MVGLSDFNFDAFDFMHPSNNQAHKIFVGTFINNLDVMVFQDFYVVLYSRNDP